jgi:hypothetical protein
LNSIWLYYIQNYFVVIHEPIIIITVAVGLGAIVTIIGRNHFIQNQTTEIDETKPWLGLSCDGMLDFSGSDEHQDLTMDQHMEFHNYYFDHCTEIEVGKHST